MSTEPSRELGVAIVGFGWMGRAHSQSYARVRHHFPDLALLPRLVSVADEVPGRAAAAAAQFGFAGSTTDWRVLLDDPAVDAVSITAPNFLHAELGSAFAAAGKHIWIEKPVGLTTSDARAVADAAAAAGVQTQVGFNYRNAPAVQQARALIADGAIGAITHATVRLLSDYAAHPDGALTWRYLRAQGGNGALGDLASHGVDLARHLLGDIAELVADTSTFISRRPLPSGATSGHQRAGGGALGEVENEDWLSTMLRMTSGARVHLEVSRVAVGEQNTYGFTVHGTTGQLSWDFRRMGELVVGTGDPAAPAYQDQMLTTIYAGPTHPDYAAFQPGAGIPMSYDDLKVIELRNFLRAIEIGAPVGATVHDAVRSAQALDAMVTSVAERRWVQL